ncbi:RidA family protein [Novosphingobium sp. SG751A]|uniref:RidA family protein n=1 Tax=Novosphingobium sp. SG751A TaxID=2587000 RepID=UPI001552AFA2|nr:RidA family protein [Novosphingobium sp. SG751A]
MSDIIRLVTNARRGRAVIYNGILSIGGQTAADCSSDVRSQMEQTLQRIDEILAEVGTDRSRLLTAQIWLKNIERDFAVMNEVWDSWIDPATAPTRATAQCEMASPRVLVEIIITAAA